MPEANTATTPNRRSRRHTYTAIISALSVVLVVLLYASIQTASLRKQVPLDLQEADLGTNRTQQEPNGFQLHPSEHASRPPKVISQNWTITTGLRRPDGVLKQVYLVNDAFPGPLLEFRSGDRVVINVKNALLGDEEVSIHWHGLSMRGANDQDGVAGVTQDPIEPGDSFTYDFTIGEDVHGSFWYHAHSAVQRADGLFGGLIVHRPVSVGQGETSDDAGDEYLLLLQDWYHRPAEAALDFYMHPGTFGNEPVPDSMLMNGAGVYNCSNAVPARPLDCEQRTLDDMPQLRLDRSRTNLIRIVNAGAYAPMTVALTGAQIRPVAVDGGSTVDAKYARSVGLLYPGERVDVLVDPPTDQAAQDLDLEVAFSTDSFKYTNPALSPTQRFAVQWHGERALQHNTKADDDWHLDLQTLKAQEDVSNVLPAKADVTIVLYAITQKLAHLKNGMFSASD